MNQSKMGSEQLYAINQTMSFSKTCVTDNTSDNATCCKTCQDSRRARTMTHYESIKHLRNRTHKQYYRITHKQKQQPATMSIQGCKTLNNTSNNTNATHKCTIYKNLRPGNNNLCLAHQHERPAKAQPKQN